MKGLAGQRIAIVGGTAGIGLAVAKAAALEGADVLLGSSTDARVDAAVSAIGGSAAGRAIDVCNDASVGSFFDWTGPIDHLVYSAGDWKRRRTTIGPEFEIEDARAAFEVRFWGFLRTVDIAASRIAQSGSIVATGGALARRPQKGQALSTAVTGAAEHLVRGLAVDLAPVRVNIVVPGLVATKIWSRLDPESLDRMAAAQPIPRAGQPDEIAEAYLSFMCSTYATGQASVVDGGLTLG